MQSLEYVVKYYLQHADERTEQARAESHQATVLVDDLDNFATAEELLLSAVSPEVLFLSLSTTFPYFKYFFPELIMYFACIFSLPQVLQQYFLSQNIIINEIMSS